MNKKQIEEEVRAAYAKRPLTFLHSHDVVADTVGELLKEIKNEGIPDDAVLDIGYESDILRLEFRRPYSEGELEKMIQYDIKRKAAAQDKQIAEAKRLLKSQGYTVEEAT